MTKALGVALYAISASGAFLLAFVLWVEFVQWAVTFHAWWR